VPPTTSVVFLCESVCVCARVHLQWMCALFRSPPPEGRLFSEAGAGAYSVTTALA